MFDEKRAILTIAIPTYNRGDFLSKNLKRLEEIICELEEQEAVMVLVSDNCSADETAMLFCAGIERKIHVHYHKNETNIGPRMNTANLFGIVQSDYIMLLGDDDFISAQYLKQVLKSIREGAGCVIPSYVNVDLDGNEIGRGRDLGCNSKKYEAGFENCLENAWRGHQISGLVYRVEGIKEEIVAKNVYNYYLQIYALAYCCLNGTTYHITEHPVLVTRPPQKTKTWGYGDDGLVGDVFENFAKLDISDIQKVKLEMKFLSDQYWRYAMYLKRGIGKFFCCIGNILKSPYTLWQTKVLFALSFGFILVGKAVSLLFSGKLLKTLSTKVDI